MTAPQYPNPSTYPNNSGSWQPPASYPAAPAYPSAAPAYPSAAPAYPSAAPAYPSAAQPAAVRCRFCGCAPAVNVTFREHHGLIVLMQFVRLPGPFCRDCGVATFRRMTAATLLRGWYGYASMIITPITVLINIARRGKVASLPAPVPAPDGSSRRPMDPGAPLLARVPALIGLALPTFVIVLVIALAAFNA